MDRWELLKWAEHKLGLYLDVNEEDVAVLVGQLLRHVHIA
jgi:hypothetical protein